ncbi:hypothetical protein [Microbacterium luticocti]|uniref:hypothetical protein n=1 Tax=Microbacterium luticocti TaxID=451764 RepID=UPI00040E382D|nr:hypothetical protein [Microbacterium luticocti]
MTCIRPILATVTLGAVLLVAGCTGEPAPTASPTLPLVTPQNHDASPRPDASPTPVGDPTCERIIPQTTVDAFTQAGWTSRQDPFYVGNIELAGGIQCTWGDATVASDQVQVFGWAPIDAETAGQVEKELLDSGWKEFSEDGAVYLTATGTMIMNPDDDGYGMTYRITDGQIIFADTKQGLLLIQWPPH